MHFIESYQFERHNQHKKSPGDNSLHHNDYL